MWEKKNNERKIVKQSYFNDFKLISIHFFLGLDVFMLLYIINKIRSVKVAKEGKQKML